MTDDKIRAAYERITKRSGFIQTVSGYIMFKAGYLALLNSLEYVGSNNVADLYSLPDGVSRNE